MDEKKRLQYIQRYEDGLNAVAVALDHLAEADLDLVPAPGASSARQVVHHLADAELHEAITLRRMLAENMPLLQDWDSELYARRLSYARPIRTSLESFRAVAASNIELLRLLTPEQWRREGNQHKPWTLTVEGWLEDRVGEIHNDLMQILNAPTGGRAISN